MRRGDIRYIDKQGTAIKFADTLLCRGCTFFGVKKKNLRRPADLHIDAGRLLDCPIQSTEFGAASTFKIWTSREENKWVNGVTMCYIDKKKTRMSVEDYLSIGTDLLMRIFIKSLLSRNTKRCIGRSFYQQPRSCIPRGVIYIAIILQRFFGPSTHYRNNGTALRDSHVFNA